MLEIDELDDSDVDDWLELLLDDDDELDEEESDDPPVLLSLLLDDDSSGTSVHVAHISIVNARLRMRSRPTVSAATLAPASFAPYTVKPVTVLSQRLRLRSRTMSRAAPRLVVTVLPSLSLLLSVYDEISTKIISSPVRPAYSSGCSALTHCTVTHGYATLLL